MGAYNPNHPCDASHATVDANTTLGPVMAYDGMLEDHVLSRNGYAVKEDVSEEDENEGDDAHAILSNPVR